jgi:hypothetical protein
MMLYKSIGHRLTHDSDVRPLQSPKLIGGSYGVDLIGDVIDGGKGDQSPVPLVGGIEHRPN